MVTKLSITGTMSFGEVLAGIGSAFTAGGWSYDWIDDSQRGIKLTPPVSLPNIGTLQVQLFFPTEVNHIFDLPCLLMTVKGGDNDDRPTTFGTTILHEGTYTFFVGKTYFYILPPETQTNNRRFGTLVSLLDFSTTYQREKTIVGYFVWADRTPDQPSRRTDHGINLSSPDYIYVSPDGRRFNTLSILWTREIPSLPFSKTYTYSFHQLTFGFTTSELTFPAFVAPDLFIYSPPNLGGVPLQLSPTVAPETIYIEGQYFVWLSVAPPLSIPLYGKVS